MTSITLFMSFKKYYKHLQVEEELDKTPEDESVDGTLEDKSHVSSSSVTSTQTINVYNNQHFKPSGQSKIFYFIIDVNNKNTSLISYEKRKDGSFRRVRFD